MFGSRSGQLQIAAVLISGRACDAARLRWLVGTGLPAASCGVNPLMLRVSSARETAPRHLTVVPCLVVLAGLRAQNSVELDAVLVNGPVEGAGGG